MKKQGKIPSLNAAASNLKRFFSGSENDSVSLDDIFVAVKRTDKEPERNRAWLSNKTTPMYYHNLIKPIYSYDGRKKLEGLSLTINGKKALGRIDGDIDIIKTDNTKEDTKDTYTLNDVAKAVKQFRDNNPEYEVIFDIKLKGVEI